MQVLGLLDTLRLETEKLRVFRKYEKNVGNDFCIDINIGTL